jgi:hypothetical protein
MNCLWCLNAAATAVSPTIALCLALQGAGGRVKGYTLAVDWQTGSVSVLRAVDSTSLNSSSSSSSANSSSNSNSRHAQPPSLADYCRCLEADLKPLWRVTGDHFTAGVSAATTATAGASAGWLHRSADTDVYGDAEYCLTNEGVLRGESVAVLHNPVLPIALVATSWH